MRGIQKETILILFKVIFQNLPGGTERNHEKPENNRRPEHSEYKEDYWTLHRYGWL
jgi:hypothetical protein